MRNCNKPHILKAVVVLSGLAVAISATSVYAGAWTQKRGEGYYKLGLRVVRATEFYEPNGNRVPIPTTGDYTVSFYGERGINDQLTLIVNLPFKRITLNRQVERSGFERFPGDAKTGLSDTDIGARFRLLQKGNTVVSAELLLGVPIGDDRQASGLLTGDGEFNQLLKLQLGQSFYPKPLYFSGEFGFNNRSRGYSDEIRYLAELGFSYRSAFQFVFRIRGVASLKNGDSAITGGTAGLFANDQSYLVYGPEVIYQFNQSFGVTAGIEGATLAENVLSAPAFTVGLFLK
jgi:hypothetical protein